VGVLHVSCAAVGGYVPHSAAMLHSVLAHRGELGAHVHYLHTPRLSEDARLLLREMVERQGGAISLYEIGDERVEGLPSEELFTPAMWFRIFLPELLPDVDRVLYLDVDTLAVDSLEPLWRTDLTGYLLGAVTNVFERHRLGRPAMLGLAGPHVYFNSGVLLLNLVEMRRAGSTAAILDYARGKGAELEWPDQDALNVVLGGRRLGLHPRWNCMNSTLTFPWAPEVFGEEAVEEARRHPGIRHFEGPERNKPWHYMCDFPHRRLYAKHRRQTPWPRFRREEATPRNALRRVKRAVRP
jgi:lipopolysaccharide biosynthesis glycosyltransferase